MKIARVLLLGCFSPVFLHASEPDPLWVRVAVLRGAPTLEDALRALCKSEYWGTIRVVKNKRGSYEAINILDVEDFLLGVIGREMNPRGPLEALKAQAIAARSHALYQAGISDDQSYDLIANLSQAYAGKTRLSKNVVLAIETTRGRVLYHNGRPVPAYFHASCGGHTETIASVWRPTAGGKRKLDSRWPGAVRCHSCLQTSEHQWKFEIQEADLRSALKKDGLKIGPLPSVTVLEKGAGGHALKLAIRSETGEIQLSAEKLRSLLGYSRLRSALFDVQRASNPDGTPSDRLIFQGNGHGHGVGLCQFGAREMAEKGARCDAILSHYFPDSDVRSHMTENLVNVRFNEKLEVRN